ncbi:MAG: hypothetical protein ACP5N0_10485 [Methanosarcina sp.]|uniref:hypothetical protein n=1 Tax=Methanosarcina sp. TaxID=2213 RepID=UPI003BB79DF4
MSVNDFQRLCTDFALPGAVCAFSTFILFPNKIPKPLSVSEPGSVPYLPTAIGS